LRISKKAPPDSFWVQPDPTLKLAPEQLLLLSVFMNVARFLMIDVLLKKPMYISELAKRVGLDRGTTCFHLASLEGVGLLKSEYVILKVPTSKACGKTARYYSINEQKLREAVNLIARQFPNLARMLGSVLNYTVSTHTR